MPWWPWSILDSVYIFTEGGKGEEGKELGRPNFSGEPGKVKSGISFDNDGPAWRQRRKRRRRRRRKGEASPLFRFVYPVSNRVGGGEKYEETLQRYSSTSSPHFVIFFCVSCKEPAWAVGSYSSGSPARGIPQNIILKTLQMTGWMALYSLHILGIHRLGCS